MSSRWIKKSVALAVALAIALPVVASAQTSRLEGMTLQGDYVKDYTSIYTYPSQVSNVGNLFYAEVGNTFGGGSFLNPGTVNDRSVGSVMGNICDGKFGTWAFHLRQSTPELGHGDLTGSVGGSINPSGDPNTNNNEEFDIMWGRKLGGTSIGARLNRSFYQTVASNPAVTTTLGFDPSGGGTPQGQNLARNIMGLGGGVGFEMNPNTNVELALLYQSRTWESTVSPIGGATNGSEDSPTSYLFSARAMWQWQPNVMVTPIFKWYSYDLSRKSITGGTTSTFDNSLKGWQIGAAANWALASNDMLVWGIDFIQNKADQIDPIFSFAGSGATDSTTVTESVMPRMFAALETHVNSWLTLRMGASKGAYSKLKNEYTRSTRGKFETTGTTFDMNIGCGVKVGSLMFDAVMADNSYSYANGLLGGATPTGGFFPKVTATYPF
jgi:hypothetical protein